MSYKIKSKMLKEIEDYQKKPYFIKEPYGLPAELQETGKFRKLEKYKFATELNKTKKAYGVSPYAEKDRNLNWKGTSWLNSEDFAQIVKVVPSYNEFEAIYMIALSKKFPNAKYKFAREGSVAVYIKPEKEDKEAIMRELDKYKADEMGFVKGIGTGTFEDVEGGKIIRAWWD